MHRAYRRTIKRAPQFDLLAERLGIGIRRLDIVLFDVEESISLDAESEIFPLVPGTRLRLARTRPAHSVPALRIFFEVNGRDLVTLWAIDALP